MIRSGDSPPPEKTFLKIIYKKYCIFKKVYYLCTRNNKTYLVMKENNRQTLNKIVVPELKNLRGILDNIFTDIFSRHENWNVDCTGADSTPIIFYDEVNSEPYTLDSISYNEEDDTFDIEGSSCDNWVELRLGTIDLDYYAGLVSWLLDNEEPLFAGELSCKNDDDYNEDDE